MMNLADVVLDPDWHQLVPIRRRAGTWDSGGAWVETYTDDVLDAAVHPADAGAMQMLAEGERDLPGIKVYSLQEVGNGDLIDWHGETWRVAAAGDWSDYGFFDSTAVRHIGTAAPNGSAFELA